nr:putative sulfate exporter family transporter [Rikenellaceae bacterium]
MIKNYIDKWSKTLFWVCLAGSFFCSPAIALFAGIAFAMSLGTPVASFSKRWSKRLLQYVVVGLGFGMNLHSSLAAGRDGMIFTVVSVVGVLVLGFLIGRLLGINKKSSYLISVGTAICGGSAIAAVSPVINADDDDISLSLATVFILNAVALFVFPPVGEWLELTQHQFGTWAAIAIHDTSSVVG